jgi:hypothetical protein
VDSWVSGNLGGLGDGASNGGGTGNGTPAWERAGSPTAADSTAGRLIPVELWELAVRARAASWGAPHRSQAVPVGYYASDERAAAPGRTFGSTPRMCRRSIPRR